MHHKEKYEYAYHAVTCIKIHSLTELTGYNKFIDEHL